MAKSFHLQVLDYISHLLLSLYHSLLTQLNYTSAQNCLPIFFDHGVEGDNDLNNARSKVMILI